MNDKTVKRKKNISLDTKQKKNFYKQKKVS